MMIFKNRVSSVVLLFPAKDHAAPGSELIRELFFAASFAVGFTWPPRYKSTAPLAPNGQLASNFD
jgi:hypothetical protein